MRQAHQADSGGSIDGLARKRPRNEFQEIHSSKGYRAGHAPQRVQNTKVEWPDAAIARTDLGSPTPLRSRSCPICGSKIQLEEIIDATDPTQARFWGFCPLCDTIKAYVANLNAMMGTRERIRQRALDRADGCTGHPSPLPRVLGASRHGRSPARAAPGGFSGLPKIGGWARFFMWDFPYRGRGATRLSLNKEVPSRRTTL